LKQQQQQATKKIETDFQQENKSIFETTTATSNKQPATSIKKPAR